MLAYSEAEMEKVVDSGVLVEVKSNGKNEAVW